jgi:hypothetical protein
LETEPTDEATMDTYANLLYKSGKAAEGISWEEKAVAVATEKKSEGLKLYRDTLEKMKKGEPTWPNQ